MEDMVLETFGLTRRYGALTALDGVELHLRRGEIYGLVGRNGAGKTTLMRMVTGQGVPTAGSVALFGVSGSGIRRQRSRTGVMIEIPSFAPFLSARANLEYYRRQRGIPGKAVVEEALGAVDLLHTGNKKFKAFSLGMKQRLGLALALMNRPDLLILDEPINGLDPEGVVEFRSLLRQLNQELGTTILISSHILTELSTVATCYGFMEKGRLLEEITAQELHDRCRTCLRLEVGDAAKAAAVLQSRLGTDQFQVQPGNVILLFDHLDDPAPVSAALAAAGIPILAMERKGAALEDYFLKLIGGEEKC